MPTVLIGAAAGVGVLIFLSVKSYPMDYDAEGKLLVDPFSTQAEVYQSVGKWLGFLGGIVIDRKLTHYVIPQTKSVRLTGGSAGALLCMAGMIYIHKAKHLPLGAHWGGFLVCFVMWLFLIGIVPMLLQKLDSRFCRA
ncbi:MAG: hypothetical protein IKN55_02430 [Oscillospiraceae bacterium]|nr:hypothetical protein [Oscillospiraceae bacterium]